MAYGLKASSCNPLKIDIGIFRRHQYHSYLNSIDSMPIKAGHFLNNSFKTSGKDASHESHM